MINPATTVKPALLISLEPKSVMDTPWPSEFVHEMAINRLTT